MFGDSIFFMLGDGSLVGVGWLGGIGAVWEGGREFRRVRF